MTKNLIKILFFGMICLLLLTSLAATVQAQTPSAAPSLTPTATTVPVTGLTSLDQITFSQLINTDITLTGPFDSNSFLFGLPAGWRLTQAPQLDLDMAVSFTTAIAANGQNNIGPAGTLTIQMNNDSLAVVQLDQLGEVTLHFAIPISAMQSTRTDGLMELRFSLDSGLSCNVNENIMVVVHRTSVITLPHQLTAPDTDLLKFPSPIYQDGLTFSNSALIVIPDHPSVIELQSALTVAAGLAKLTSGGSLLDLVTMSQLSAQQANNSHLILVGKASSLSSLLTQLTLPRPFENGQIRNTGGSPDDGIVQLIDSPWNIDKAVLVVTGNTDAGTLKAAQAMSTGSFRSNILPNLAVVQQIQASAQPISVPVDQTIQSLGYGTVTANNLGVNYVTFSFNIPTGQILGNDAYFELLYGHSALLDFARSGIVVLVNGNPIGSVALSDTTAKIAVNSAKFTIPPAIVHGGKNNIEIRINMLPVDRCTSPNLSGTFTNIWQGSNLHLPTSLPAISTSSNFDLTNYPAPYEYDSTLATTAFVLPKDNLQSWRDALGVAEYLGLASGGPVTTPALFYADNLPATERANYNLLIIGRASQLPIISELNNTLPAQFAKNTDFATEPNMQVVFRIDPTTPLGYVELLPSPWNNSKVIIAALGNTDQGVAWSALHLIAPASYALKGNFAVINAIKVISTDTRIASIAPLASASSTGAPAVQAIAPSLSTDHVPANRPGWVLPTLALTILLIIVTILVAVYINRLNNHPGTMNNPFGNLFNRKKDK